MCGDSCKSQLTTFRYWWVEELGRALVTPPGRDFIYKMDTKRPLPTDERPLSGASLMNSLEASQIADDHQDKRTKFINEHLNRKRHIFTGA